MTSLSNTLLGGPNLRIDPKPTLWYANTQMDTHYDKTTGELSHLVNGVYVSAYVKYSDDLPPNQTPFYPRKVYNEEMNRAAVTEVAKFPNLTLKSSLQQGHLCWLIERVDQPNDYNYTVAMEDGPLAAFLNNGGINSVRAQVFGTAKALSEKV